MVRDIRKLEGEIKQEYGLILGNILDNLKDADVFQMKAFYKVMAYIQIQKKYRRKIIDVLMSNNDKENSIENSLNSLLSKVKGQERDILRFSLMQDILSVTMANHYVSEDKKELIDKTQQLLQITDDQMIVFERELEQNGKLNQSDNNLDKEALFKRKISKYIAIGVPLTFLYYSPHNAYHHDFSSFALLQIDKKINPHKSIYSLGKYLVLGGILYKGITWGVNQKRKNQNKLERMLAEESRELMIRSEKYIEEDLAYSEKILRKNNLNNSQIRFKMLMEKAVT